MFDIIVACDKNMGVGKEGSLPWNIPFEINFFKKTTTYTDFPSQVNVVIMGYNTWKSIHTIHRPLKDRINIVISCKHKNEIIRDMKYNANLFHCFNLDEAIYKTKEIKNLNKIFVMGGKRVYDDALIHPELNRIIITRIDTDFKCDIFLDLNLNQYKLINETKKMQFLDKITNENVNLKFQILEKDQDHQEFQYINLLKKIMSRGNERDTRNAKTLSVFGEQIKFDISERFPLLTTKRMFWRGIVEELLFFVRGDTNSKNLDSKGVKIWNPNTTREFLDDLGLNHYDVGEMGPMYGYQWRSYNKPYKKDGEEGIDQLKNCIEMIKNNPTNRRILLTAYNPLQLSESVLAPCHSIVIQFYVNDNKLSCHMYQRSSDTFLGLPFNIASTALLTYLIAKITNLNPGEVIISLGDTHLYKDHIDSVKKQIKRYPYIFPKLEIKRDIKTLEDIENMEFTDFELLNYKCHKGIKANMIA
jgi:dihydrofolate reductase / thymidylate synthase